MSTSTSATSPSSPRHRCLRSPRVRTGSLHRLLTALFLTAAAVLLIAPAAGAAPPTESSCAPGSFCTWSGESYQAPVSTHSTQNVELERCLPLPPGQEVHSFANRTGHPVTAYQDPDCSTHAEFATHPDGSRTPRAPYVVRAIKIWSH